MTQATTIYVVVFGYENDEIGPAFTTAAKARAAAEKMADERAALRRTEHFDFATKTWRANPPSKEPYPTPFGVVEVELID